MMNQRIVMAERIVIVMLAHTAVVAIVVTANTEAARVI